MNFVNQTTRSMGARAVQSANPKGVLFCICVYFFVTIPEELDTRRRNSRNAPGWFDLKDKIQSRALHLHSVKGDE